MILISGANRHDSMMFEKCMDAIPAIAGLPGLARKRPAKLHADKGYDYKRCRAYLRRRGIASWIARRGVESSEKLGKHRCVVERTHGWFAGFGKLRIRFERRLDIHDALLKLAAGSSVHASWIGGVSRSKPTKAPDWSLGNRVGMLWPDLISALPPSDMDKFKQGSLKCVHISCKKKWTHKLLKG